MQDLDAELEHIGRESEWSQKSLDLGFLAREARQTVHPAAIVRGRKLHKDRRDLAACADADTPDIPLVPASAGPFGGHHIIDATGESLDPPSIVKLRSERDYLQTSRLSLCARPR